jgi:hypothetical protein
LTGHPRRGRRCKDEREQRIVEILRAIIKETGTTEDALEALIIAEEEGVRAVSEIRHDLGEKIRRRKAA